MTYKYITYFLFYSFIGWLYEVLVVLAVERKFVNRGFLRGPVCPIYGLAVLSLVIILHSFSHNLFIVFILGAITVSSIELVTGFLMEHLFHTRWWDYSRYRFNFRGYISLEIACVWGIFSIVIIDFIHPAVVSLFELPPALILQVGTYIIAALFILDAVTTIMQMFAFRNLLKKASTLELNLELHVEQLHTDFKRWFKAHPRVKSIRFKKQIDELRRVFLKFSK